MFSLYNGVDMREKVIASPLGKWLGDSLGSFKSISSHSVCVGNMEEQVTLKIDSKGRMCLPAEIREKIGDAATIKETSEGYLIIPGKTEDFIESFNKLITSEPKRKGKPHLASPEEMKSIWRTAK